MKKLEFLSILFYVFSTCLYVNGMDNLLITSDTVNSILKNNNHGENNKTNLLKFDIDEFCQSLSIKKLSTKDILEQYKKYKKRQLLPGCACFRKNQLIAPLEKNRSPKEPTPPTTFLMGKFDLKEGIISNCSFKELNVK